MRFILFILLFALCLPAFSANWVGRDGDWEDPNNWDTGTVPGVHETAILPEGEIIINTAVLVGAVIVQPDAVLIVAPDAELAIDPHGGPTFTLDVAGRMDVYGTVRRGGAITTLASLRVQVTGNWQTMPGGLLIIELGYLRLNTAAAVFLNEGELIIENNTIAAVLEGMLINKGTVSCEGIGSSSRAVYIEQDGEWLNDGLTSINGFGTAIRNDNRCYNRGQLLIFNCGEGIYNLGQVDNGTGALLYLSGIWFSDGINNRFSHSRLRNWGRLEIEGANGFFGIYNSGRVDNYSSGRIYLNGQYLSSAINNLDDATYHNYGSTEVGNNYFDGDHALRNRGYFVNYSGGKCGFYEGSTWFSIINHETFENRGYCQIVGEVFNSDYFLHTNCGEMIVDGRITNNGRTWVNEGILRLTAGSLFSNINNSQFFNFSVIEDRGGAIDPSTINNEGVLAQPYNTATVGWNPDFFELEVPGQVPLYPICFAEPEEDEVGKYELEDNGLDIYPNAIGLTTLYFFDEDCEHWFAVDVAGGVQPSSSLSGGVTNTKQEAAAFQVYPNPTLGRTYLHLPTNHTDQTYNWSVYNLQGQILQQSETLAGEQTPLDLTALPNGIYVVKLHDFQGGLIYSERLVKQ